MWTCFDVLLHPRLFCFVRNTADTCKYMLRTKQVLFAQWTIYARLTSLGDEGDTIKWRKYKKLYFIVYYIVFLLSCIFLILTFLTVTLVYRFVRWSELRENQTKREKIWAMKHAPFSLKSFIPLINVLRWIYWKKEGNKQKRESFHFFEF